jgi:hypothetical protein
MIIEIASLFVSTISALSSVVQAVKAGKELSQADVERADQLAKPDPTNSSAIALANTGIDPDYIEIAQINIERGLGRFKQVWRDPSVPQAVKDQELEAANFVVCSELKRITRLNGGVLPGDDRFHHLWAVHGCDKV